MHTLEIKPTRLRVSDGEGEVVRFTAFDFFARTTGSLLVGFIRTEAVEGEAILTPEVTKHGSGEGIGEFLLGKTAVKEGQVGRVLAGLQAVLFQEEGQAGHPELSKDVRGALKDVQESDREPPGEGCEGSQAMKSITLYGLPLLFLTTSEQLVQLTDL